MAVVKLSTSGLVNFAKYSSMLAGNSAYAPTPPEAYDLLETEILAGSQASVIFSSLGAYAADYQHLQIRAVIQDTSTATSLESIDVNFNGVTSSSYSRQTLYGNGTSADSDTTTSFGSILVQNTAGRETNIFGACVIDVLDFSSSTKNTTIRGLAGGVASAAQFISLASGAYFSTDAITSLSLGSRGTAFATDSRFSLYGLRKEA